MLLLINALFFLPQRTTTSYYVLNSVIYGAFLFLCSGYIVSDLKDLLGRRRRRSGKPEA